MKLLKEIVNKLLLTETVSISDIESAIDKHERIIITYHSKGEDKNTGARLIEVYAYGLTKAGHEILRAFEPQGDTTSRVPAWKFFRKDRIGVWQPTGQIFDKPADVYYKGLGDFNPNDDESMSVVYKIAKFGNNDKGVEDGPIINTDNDIFKTDTEKQMAKLRQQLDNNPINIKDLIGKNGFKKANDYKSDTQDSTNGLVIRQPKQNEPELYKTDIEKGINKLKQQLNNPKYIKDVNPNYEKELSNLRNKLGDTSQPIQYKDLSQRLSQKDDSSISGPKLRDDASQNEPDIFKTDTEKRIDRLKHQFDKPEKIDLTKVPKK